MARSRSIPTDLFDEPKFFSLSGETQAILLGLILNADDHGRGQAHVDWLARKLNKSEALIETAFGELEARHLVLRYQCDEQSYYVLPRWNDWQKLHKPARSRYPAPPATGAPRPSQNSPDFSGGNLEKFGGSRKVNPEVEVEVEDEEEGEGGREEEEELEDEDEGATVPSNLVPFPAMRDGGDGDEAKKDEKVAAITRQLASILRLPVSSALSRVVVDFMDHPSLSLLGEADAAREWIDDPRRNKKRKTMSPAFFRSWLRRERGDYVQASTSDQRGAATGTSGPASSSPAPHTDHARAAPAGPAYRSLMNLGAHYEAQRRAASNKTLPAEKPVNSE